MAKQYEEDPATGTILGFALGTILWILIVVAVATIYQYCKQ